jgi:hypothetical protein
MTIHSNDVAAIRKAQEQHLQRKGCRPSSQPYNVMPGPCPECNDTGLVIKDTIICVQCDAAMLRVANASYNLGRQHGLAGRDKITDISHFKDIIRLALTEG